MTAVVSPSESARRFKWNLPQSRFMRLRGDVGGAIEYQSLEGAIRSGKSSAAIAKLATYAAEYPGIHMLATRWSQGDLDAQLKPLWRDMARKIGLSLIWNANEQYDEVRQTGARVYLRGLKASDEVTRYAKLAGLTLSVIFIDQGEELPEDVFKAYVPARLSQPLFPHECWLTPNPPSEHHWLAKMFPEDDAQRKPHYHYIRTSVYDNRHNLGDAYIADLEDAYPVGTVLRRRFIDGRRGLSVQGEPVYQGYFQRAIHENHLLEMNPELPLYESWDYGHSHPAAAFFQFPPSGAMHVLGGVMGESLFLEDFAPMVLAIRKQWCPNPLVIQSTGDPAGAAKNSQGTNRNAVDTLKALGVEIEWVPNANHPDRRNTAIQAIASYMRKRTPQGEAFQINPRFIVIDKKGQRSMPVLVDGFEAGYVWDDRQATTNARSPNTRKPKKDGFYDHSQNVTEYAMLKFAPSLPELAQKPLQLDEPTLSGPDIGSGVWGEALGTRWMG